MAKKRATSAPVPAGAKKKGAQARPRTCGECARGTWSRKHINRDLHGRAFLKGCVFATWARNQEGEVVTLRTTAACEHFIEGGETQRHEA